MSFSAEMKVLDLACGMGRTCRWVAPHVKEYVGADFIPEMIEKAKSYNSSYSNAKFFVTDGKALNIFDDNTFDIIYSDLAFQHMVKSIQKSYSDDVYRVLKNEGLFYVQLPKIEYYKDDIFALTKKEYNDIMQKFLIVEQIGTDAYYYVKAKKILDEYEYINNYSYIQRRKVSRRMYRFCIKSNPREK